jgi:hypothetical protein
MWTPYRHLPYYAAEQSRGRANTRQRLRQEALRHARAICDRSVPSRFRPEGEEFSAGELGQPIGIGSFSRQVESFVELPRSRSREALDEFLLLYFQRGFGLKGAVERAWRDYQSIGDEVIQLGLLDVLDYASFFWNFSGADPEAVQAYASACFQDGGPLRSVLDGSRSLTDARVDWGAVRGFQAGKELKRMAMINTRLSQQLSRELMQEDGIGDTRRYKNIASFQRTTMIVTQAAQEIGTNEEEAIELGEFFEDMWDEIDQDIDDYRALESTEVSPEDLQAENDEVLDADDTPSEELPEASAPDALPEEGTDNNTDSRAY